MLGMGSGQPNRLESLRIAMIKARDEVKGAALASDAFFPFGITPVFDVINKSWSKTKKKKNEQINSGGEPDLNKLIEVNK